MAKHMQIYASMNGVKDVSKLSSKLKSVLNAGIDGLHVDLIDGKLVNQDPTSPIFVPKYITSVVSYAKSRTKNDDFPVDLHLLVENPSNMADQYLKIGISRLTLPHSAFAGNTDELLKYIRIARRQVEEPEKVPQIGVSFSINDINSDFELNALSIVDYIHIIGSGPGYDMTPPDVRLCRGCKQCVQAEDGIAEVWS